jgi:hypothetical protein
MWAWWYQVVNDKLVNIFVNGGNIGIGTNIPTTKLDVNGNANFSGTTSTFGNTNISGNINLGGSAYINGTITAATHPRPQDTSPPRDMSMQQWVEREEDD